jgi:hypothetical protein
VSYEEIEKLHLASPSMDTNNDRYMPSAATGSTQWKTNVVGKQQDLRVYSATREHYNVDQLWTIKHVQCVVMCCCCQKPMVVYSPLLSIEGGDAILANMGEVLDNYLDMFPARHGCPLVGHKIDLAQLFYVKQANACASRIEPHYFSTQSKLNNVGLCVWCGRSSTQCDLEVSGRAEDGKRYYPQCSGASIDSSMIFHS